MITKAQKKSFAGEFAARACPKLNALEKGMLKWAVVDPEDKVLDATVGEGVMAEYLRRNMQCEVCGVTDDMEDLRRARARLQSCDIVYAAQGDIPWHNDAFDVVLMKSRGDEETIRRAFREVHRVLREGGQMVLGLACYPAIMNALSGLVNEESIDAPVKRKKLSELLKLSEFEHLDWQRTGLNSGVLLAWKRKPDTEAAKKE